MKIRRDEQFADEIKQKLRALQLAKRRDLGSEIHISEILNPRKAYWTRTLGERVTDESIGFFIAGEAFHRVVQDAMGSEFSEHKLRLPGIVGTADFRGAYLCEIKTSRKWTVPSDPDPYYVEQETAYQAMDDREVGYIFVIYFTAGRKWDGTKPSTLEMVAWRVELSKQDRADIRARLLQDAARLNKALGKKDPLLLQLCADWMCAGIYKNEVQRVCPYYKECQPEGRYPIETLLKPIEDKKKKVMKVLDVIAESTTDLTPSSAKLNGAGVSFVKKLLPTGGV
jgi:hypothetical protein